MRMNQKRSNWMERIQLTCAVLALAIFVVPTQAIEIAGELFVDLSASDPSAGTASWTNNGTLGDFEEVGDPMVGTIGPLSSPAVTFDGTNDVYTSVDTAPAGLVGVDPTRTIEAWVFNPEIASEETVVSWGKRGGGDGTNMSFNYGNHGNFGAVGHWGGGGPDMGWVDNAPDFTPGAPAAGEWHHLVYSYDGTTTRAYSDGELQNSEELGAGVINTHTDTKIAVASQWEGDGVTLTPGLRGSLSIGALRIHDGVLNDEQIMSNYLEELPTYVPEPTALALIGIGLLGFGIARRRRAKA